MHLASIAGAQIRNCVKLRLTLASSSATYSESFLRKEDSHKERRSAADLSERHDEAEGPRAVSHVGHDAQRVSHDDQLTHTRQHVRAGEPQVFEAATKHARGVQRRLRH